MPVLRDASNAETALCIPRCPEVPTSPPFKSKLFERTFRLDGPPVPTPSPGLTLKPGWGPPVMGVRDTEAEGAVRDDALESM